MAHGVRKVNEYIMRDGRALILTQALPTSLKQEQWDSIEDGTIYLTPNDGNIYYKKLGNDIREWTKFKPGNLFIDKDITGNFLADKTITEIKMADDSVSTRTIIDRNVTGDKIALEAITLEHIKPGTLNGDIFEDNSVDASKLIDLSITNAKIADRTIEAVKLVELTITDKELAANSVITNKIKDLNVTTAKLANSAVTTAKIADSNITTAKIADANVTLAKMANNSVDYLQICKDAVRSDHIKDGEVIQGKLGTSAVVTANIGDLQVTEAKLAANAVTTNKIKNGNVTLAKLATDVQSVINNAVVYANNKVTIDTPLVVKGNITADPNNKTLSITGFKVYNPVFADYAEGFEPIEKVEEGDIVEIADFGRIRKADSHSTKIIGIVSNRYGMCLDASQEDLESGKKVAVGLVGKVPVKIAGKVEAGDFIISSGDGVGIATKKHIPGAIIGKALESKDSYGIGKVLCLIQPM